MVGVILARMDFFMPVDKTLLFYLSVSGILLAFAGIAVYASAMPHVVKKVKICPACFTKNEIEETACKKCKALLLCNDNPGNNQQTSL